MRSIPLRPWRSANSEQPLDLTRIEVRDCDRRTVPEQHGNLVPKPSQPLGIRVDIEHVDRWQGNTGGEDTELIRKFLAEAAALASQ